MSPSEPPSFTVYRRGSTLAGGDPNRTVVWLHGEHDAATVPTFLSTLADAARLDEADVVVDLSRVRFMDAATMGALVRARDRLHADGRELTIRNPSPRARMLLELCGFQALIDDSAHAMLTSAVLAPNDRET